MGGQKFTVRQREHDSYVMGGRNFTVTQVDDEVMLNVLRCQLTY